MCIAYTLPPLSVKLFIDFHMWKNYTINISID